MFSDLCPSYPVGRVPHSTLAMSSSEEADLLRVEEIFSTTLARTISLILQPLLLAGECKLSVGKVGGGTGGAPRDTVSPLLDILRQPSQTQVEVLAVNTAIF